MAAKIYM